MLSRHMFAAALFPGVIRLGNLRVSVFGFFAAAGLIAAVSLSQKTARLARLEPQRVWDAGVWSIVAAFVLSRALLFLEDPAAFRRYPLIVLSLPSLTYPAMVLTVVATLLYLRWKKMPLLSVLDAWTPPAALLAAVLALAHFVEGTDAGMPTSLPWGVVTPGDTILGRVHPVQIYMLLAAAVVGGFSYRALTRPHAAGATAARAMAEGGMLFFVLDMFAQPYDAHSTMPLDPGQTVGLAFFVVGFLLWAWIHQRDTLAKEGIHAQ
jgi:phosphatidylglycerol:prolipoprotein diacylglycerol transferase